MVARILPNGTGLDTTYGVNGLFTLPPVFGPNTWDGDGPNEGRLDPNGNMLVSGIATPDTKGCLYGFPLLVRVTPTGNLDTTFNLPTGYIVEGTATGPTQADMSNFTDYTGATPVNLGYAQYESSAVHNNGGPLQGRIVAVGDGDVNAQETTTPLAGWPLTARIIVARYKPNGCLDTSFGINGRLVISGINLPIAKQLVAHSVAIDASDNIYIVGDIADVGSGAAGETIPGAVPGELVGRPSANFLLIKLNSSGIPQNYGPMQGTCNSETSYLIPPAVPLSPAGCQSNVFASCATCTLQWGGNSPSTPVTKFTAVSTDFKGFDDSAFDLTIDNTYNFLTVAGQASQDNNLESQVFGYARYNLATGVLDPSFGTEGLTITDFTRIHRALSRNMLVDQNGQILSSGQSAFSDVVTTTNFEDATETDFAAVRLYIKETEQQKLTGTGESGVATLGYSVALSADGNTLAAGGPNDNVGIGAVWIFTRSAGTWTQQGLKLTGTGEIGAAQFGYSVALSADGNTLAVGGPYDGVDGDDGAVWIFTRTGTTWTEQMKISSPEADAQFGYSLALSADGNTLAAGGPFDHGDAGAVWIFTRSEGIWTQGPKLTGTGAIGFPFFGYSVSLSADGNTLAAGGVGDNGAIGAVWIFTRIGTTWTEQQKITVTDNIGASSFGYSVSLSTNGNNLAASGPDDNSANGAVWIFARGGTTWIEQQKITVTDNIGPADFGDSVSLSGTTLAAGGPEDNEDIGAVWVFV